MQSVQQPQKSVSQSLKIRKRPTFEQIHHPQEEHHHKLLQNQDDSHRIPNHTHIDGENHTHIDGEGHLLIQIEKLSHTHTEENNKEKQTQTSLLQYFKHRPDPILNWEQHQEKYFYSDFLEFIETLYQQVKRSQSINRYYVKIGLQIFIYLLNFLELIFTLSYASYNQISNEYKIFTNCHIISIFLCVSIHCITWMYTYKFRQVQKKFIVLELLNYIYYMLLGALSYFKIAPFIYYFIRDQSIRQFSFSEINKYLILDGEDKFRNPLRLFKLRTKPVNIFRDLIFHRIALVSMMITMFFQTIPQLFIQGFYNSKKETWNDGFNVISYMLLISSLIYYLLELQFIILTTTYRQIQTELQFKLKKIKLKFIEETKQLLKADLKYMAFIQSFYFHIDPSKFSSYQKKRCMVQIITFLTRQKKFKSIQFLFLDQYEQVTLQYLANCVKIIQVEKISFLYKDQTKLHILESIFNKEEFPYLNFQLQNSQNIDEMWNSDIIDLNSEEEKVQQIQFIENPKINKEVNTGWQALYQNQQLQQIKNRNYITISSDFKKFIQQNQKYSETSNDIIKQAKEKIDSITKKDLFAEQFKQISFFINLYDCYQKMKSIQEIQGFLYSFGSLLNGGLQIISLIYLTEGSNMFITALIVINVIYPILQMLSFAFFQFRLFQDFSIKKQILNVILFVIINLLKILDLVIFVLYLLKKQFTDKVKRDFSAKGYQKFKSYAAKFEGSIAISVFQWDAVKVNESIFSIKKQPFYQAVIWRAGVEEALIKIALFYIYYLSTMEGALNPTFLMSSGQQIKEGIKQISEFLECFIKDFLIPAFILSTTSVEQFFQSMLFLSSISNQILLEYPKSFQIMSKVNERYLKEKCTFKINAENLDFSNYGGKKKEKILAQFRYVLASIQNILEIDQAQKLFCMGSELNDFVKCLNVSSIYQLKLNFSLDEVNPENLPYVNHIIQYCPNNLQFLQISIESTEQINMLIDVKRKDTLKAFCYSYFQIITLYKDNTQGAQKTYLNIDQQFLQLDRYDFEQFYLEIAGNLILDNCSKFLENFIKLKIQKLSLKNNSALQIFKFQKNIKSELEILDITFENITLDFQQFFINKLKTFRLILNKCEFSKQDLKKILSNLKDTKLQMVYIDIKNCNQNFTKDEQIQLLSSLEQNKIDATIKI
ncbi:unnamed protein product [Paramecium sonneborni]|uniref:Transmembrane protein n=1 Tax=Paramecium sonneborni TaxID=65129 RepID=A0A8S1RH57_9CILI|nr:unnamed protein product [Paramecium sonneborni]